jgi:hypothetical protein
MRSTLAVFAIHVLGMLAVIAVVRTAAVHSDHADILKFSPRSSTGASVSASIIVAQGRCYNGRCY